MAVGVRLGRRRLRAVERDRNARERLGVLVEDASRDGEGGRRRGGEVCVERRALPGDARRRVAAAENLIRPIEVCCRFGVASEQRLETRAHVLDGVVVGRLRVDDHGVGRERGEVFVGGVDDDEPRGRVVGAYARRGGVGLDEVEDGVARADEVDGRVGVLAPTVE